MFENKTYENILQEMLERVPDDIDKRENSPMWNALSPAAAEQAKFYVWLDAILQLVYADTSAGEYLTRRIAEFGTYRKEATKAQRKGLFYDEDDSPYDIPIGSRFFIEERYYVAVNRLTEGQYLLECEEAGITGNTPYGEMLPLENIAGLARAELSDVIVPGIDEESDEALYARYQYYINEQPFGGNRADYKRKITAIDGVGGVKLFRTPAGGGTVGTVIIDASFSVPSTELIDNVQTEMDPVVNQGDGIGTAPIGHRLTVSGVAKEVINVETTLTLNSESTIGQVQADVESVIEKYCADLRKEWKDGESTDFLVVRISQIESRILVVEGVQDIGDTILNGVAANVELSPTQIPELGAVMLHD